MEESKNQEESWYAIWIVYALLLLNGLVIIIGDVWFKIIGVIGLIITWNILRRIKYHKKIIEKEGRE